jgi:VWFA-related protein
LLDAAFAGLKPTLDDKSRSLDAVSEAAGQLAALPAAFRRVILLVAQPGDVGSAAKLPDVLRRIEVNNIIVYSLAMPHIGKEIARKTISIGSPRGKFGGNDTGIMGAVELSKLVPELYRDADAAAARDAVSILTAETGGSRANFRRLRDYESGLSAIAEELHTEYVLTYTPDSAEPGYHRIRVELARSGLTLRARPGYYNPE